MPRINRENKTFQAILYVRSEDRIRAFGRFVVAKNLQSRLETRSHDPYTKFTALVTVPFTGRTCSAALHVKPIRQHVRENTSAFTILDTL